MATEQLSFKVKVREHIRKKLAVSSQCVLPEKIEKLKKCRICLVENVRMFVVANKNLREIYEKLTDVPFVTEDSRPMLACFFCYAKLKQCYQLQRKCLEAEELFSQMLNEDYETKLLINQDLLEFFNGFVVTPTVHISTFDECQVESDDIKQELPEVCEGQDNVIELNEQHQNELEHEYQDEDYVDNFIYVPPHQFESDSEDDVPLKEFKTEVEVKQEVSKTKRTSNTTERTPVAKKPKQHTRRPKLEDTITAQQKKTEQPDSKISRNTQKRTSKTVTKVKKPIANNSINKAIRSNSNKHNLTTKILSNKGIQNDGMNRRRLIVKEKPFICDTCQRSFSRKEHLKEHIRMHTGEKPFQCDICGRGFTHKKTFILHIQAHEGNKFFPCDICQRSFSRETQLKVHIRLHNGEKPFQCDICGRGFVYNSSLKTHILVHKGKNLFQCDICQRGFSSKYSLIYHIRAHNGEKPFQCHICGRRFAQKHSLISHGGAHTGAKPYKCEICNRCFSVKATLAKHTRFHTGEKLIKCKICPHVANCNYHLKRHMKTHSGEKPYKCDICQRRFSQKNDIKRHARIHTGHQPYKCEICQRGFNEKNKLTNHIRQHTGEKPFKCDICQDSFCVKSSLDRHIRSHAGEKPYKCEICQRRFSNISDLKRHNLIHTGEKPFKCEICQKTFTQTSSLNVHRRTHTKDRKS